MKSHFCLLACLLSVTSAFAERARFEIVTQYEGFDPKLLAEAKAQGTRPAKPDTALAAPRVTVFDGQKATVEIIREEPISLGADHKVNSGITLEVELSLKDGQIHLTGSSMVRHRLDPGDKQPLGAVSFATRETYFDGDVADGKPLDLRVGDGPEDPSKIMLTVKRAEPLPPAHTSTPEYHVYSLKVSAAEIQDAVYKVTWPDEPSQEKSEKERLAGATADSLRQVGLDVQGFLTAARSSAVLKQFSADSREEIADADKILTVSKTLCPDGRTVDLHLVSRARPATNVDVTLDWDSSLLVTVADASQPDGQRHLIISPN